MRVQNNHVVTAGAFALSNVIRSDHPDIGELLVTDVAQTIALALSQLPDVRLSSSQHDVNADCIRNHSRRCCGC